MKYLLTISLFLLSIPFANATLVTEEVSYSADGTNMNGYIVYDNKFKNKRPGILVVHEWWGHNNYARKRAKQLARLGYTAIAVDMYGDKKQAGHPKDASAFSSAVRNNLDLMTNRFNAAKKVLSQHSTVDSDKIAAIGYCFGGSVVLEMARQGADLKAVVSFHGGLAMKYPVKEVKAKVLVLNGAADPFVKQEHIDTFKDDMDAAGASYKYVAYPGAKHAFTNPGATDLGKKFGIPLQYDRAADDQSWNEMKGFLAKAFK